MAKSNLPRQRTADQNLQSNNYRQLTKITAWVVLSLLLVDPSSAQAFAWFSKASASVVATVNLDETVSFTEATVATLEAPIALVDSKLNTANVFDAVVFNSEALVVESGVAGTAADLLILEEQSNDKISVYEIREGDTIADIAKMFNTSANTIKSINNLKSDSDLKVGETLEIFPFIGIKYVVESGDSILGIAERCRPQGDEVSTQDFAKEILAFNNIDNSNSILIGSELIIPNVEVGCRAPVKKTTSSGSTAAIKSSASGPSLAGYFSHPLPGSVKTQHIHGHNGVDMAGVPVGTSILAAASGKVIVAKNDGLYNGGYGNYVVIEHPNGVQTLYGHLHFVSVSVGQQVTKGQKIGGMGNTGRSTGPHLHFEVRGAVNPF